ncbi:MAG TPA: outer membrane beta-barrel protein [Verrucomicrobiae bacterium]
MTKRILAVTGMLAAGFAMAQTAQAQEKPWNVSAKLRGFYDDNYATAPSNPVGAGVAPARDSLGFELSPSASLNLNPGDQTSINASYTYSMRYFEDRVEDSADHSHIFQGRLTHNFSERARLELNESFAIAQEPQLLDPATLTRPLRSEGDNIRNIAGFVFGIDVTRLLGFEFGYQNSFYDYEQEGLDSLSARLDRMEHQVMLNSRWMISEPTTGIFGYTLNITDYNADDQITPPVPPGPVAADTRNSISHSLYVGADHSFSRQFLGSFRVGGTYTEYPNAVVGVSSSALSPYVDISGNYSYGDGSYVMVGARVNRSSTDVNNSLDQQAYALYGSVNHRITPRLIASVIGQYQYSRFSEGPEDGSSDNFFAVGLNLSYEINNFLSAETGYNYDRLDSNVTAGNRSYTRNRVYIGIRATY